MENSKKITILGLSKRVLAAVTPLFEGVGFETTEDATDLILSDGEPEKIAPAVPVLRLDRGRTVRVGRLLQLAEQMTAAPWLYLDPFMIGGHEFNPADKTFMKQGQEIALTDKETAILVCLAQAGDAMLRDVLLKKVWRYQDGIDTHTLETHVYRLRQKIEDDAAAPAILLTDGEGYRLTV